MRRFFEILLLEFRSIVRSKTLLLLSVVAVGWMWLFPLIAKGDGTAEGARELYLHYSLGGVFALLVVTLLSSATGSIARERVAKRLQLTMVRPVWYFSIALGKIFAYALAGAMVLALAVVVSCFRADLSIRCNHVLSPVLPTPQEEAKMMYESYMKDPNTPDEVKKARKSLVMRILTQRALDHYQTLPTNSVTFWDFPVSETDLVGVSVRMRFTNQYEMRQDVRGEFRLGGLFATVSNITQAVVSVPFNGVADGEARKLSFANHGDNALMLRPRKDVNLLFPADAFVWNLLRAYIVMVSVLVLVIAFGVFLSAALGRPVALFVAIVTLLVSEMSPSVVEQYPDQLESNLADRIGLHITRAAASITRPISAIAPLEALAKDECIEPSEVAGMALMNLLVIPVFLALFAALIMPRKQED